MTISKVSGMKMKNFLVGAIFGFLAAVHSTPVDTESDVLQEAMKDEFLIPSLTTQIRTRDTTIQAFRQLYSDFKKSEIIESSSARNESRSDPSSTQNSQSDLRPGDEELPDQYPTTVSSTSSSPRKEASTALSTSTAPPAIIGYEVSDSGSGMSEEPSQSTIAAKTNTQFSFLTHKHSTQTSDLGSENEQIPDQSPTAVSSRKLIPGKEARPSLSSSTAPHVIVGSEISDSGSGMSEEPSQSTIAAKTNTQFSFLTRPHSTQTSDLGSENEHLPDQSPTAVSSRKFIPVKEARPSLSTSTATQLTVGSEVSDLGSGISEEPSESTIAVKTNTQFSFLTRPHSTQTSDLGSENEHLPDQSPTAVSSRKIIPVKEARPSLSTSTAPQQTVGSEVSDSGPGISEELSESNTELQEKSSPVSHELPQNTGHSTPGWIIILAGVVGVAAVVIVCVAIVTREKWYGPSQVSQLETKTSQQRELEMETFLHKDKPRENGNADEYIVIPLDELPETYTSH